MPDPRFHLPGYDVVRLIGAGATGEVWLAREAASGDPVALKRVRLAADDLSARNRMRREAVVLSEVDHPHVIRLRSLVALPGETVLVLDHAGGGSLEGLLAARGRILPAEVVTVAVPLAQALAAVHEQGILHGDVTPSNVLFTAEGRPLLADLGIARLFGEPVGDVEGTVGYADPAVVRGGVPTPASDVYGLGAVCFAALTGVPPYEGADPVPVRTLGDASSDLRSLVADMPEALAVALDAALDADPAARPTAAELAVAMYDACPPVPVRLMPAALDTGAASPVEPIEVVSDGPTDAVGVGWHDTVRHAAADAVPGASDDVVRGGSDGPDRLLHLAAAGSPAADSLTRRIRVARVEPADTGAGPAAGGGRRSLRRRPSRGDGPPRERHGRRLPWAAMIGVLLAMVSVAAAVAVGVLWAGASSDAASERVAGRGRPPDGAATPSATTAARDGAATGPDATTAPDAARAAPLPGAADAGSPDWLGILEGLYAARSDAFAAGETALLAEVYAAESPDLASNTEILETMVRAGVRALDVRVDVVSAEPVARDTDRVTLRAVDVLADYRVVSPDGKVLEERAGRAEQAVDVTLVRTAAGWRIASTTEAAST